jgi:cytochrome c-type biogenesis protein CcmE
MKLKYIVGLVGALLVVITAVLVVNAKKIEYADLADAATSGRRAQIAGTWVKTQGNTYDPATNEFKFTLKDEKGTEMPVILAGAKPNNFELATSVVVTGYVEHGTVRASAILTKCPSKYEGDGTNLKGSYSNDDGSGSSK